MKPADIDATLRLAERVAELLEARGLQPVVIGAMALAVHNYPRETEDFDLAVAVAPNELARLARELEAQGLETELRESDADDPLGGVIDIRAPGAELVQVVNFDNSPAGGFPRLAREAARTAVPFAPESRLRAADLPSLVAMKLYAGGPKSKLDILELLDRNPTVDLVGLRRRLAALGLERSFDRVLALRQEP